MKLSLNGKLRTLTTLQKQMIERHPWLTGEPIFDWVMVDLMSGSLVVPEGWTRKDHITLDEEYDDEDRYILLADDAYGVYRPRGTIR